MPHCESSVMPVRACAECARVRTYNELAPSKFSGELAHPQRTAQRTARALGVEPAQGIFTEI
jgi:hypothetical protein